MPTVLVTGANRGIGAEFVRSFAADGWRVLAGARKPGAVSRAAGEVRVFAIDVAQPDAIRAAAQELAGEALDLLINNAGLSGRPAGEFGRFDAAGWRDTLLVNTAGPLLVSEAFLPHLERGKEKKIVALTSRMGSIAENSGGYYAYRASKAGLNAAMKSLAAELAPRGFTIAVLHPGWVQTDMGGAGAPLPVANSVRDLRRLIAGLKPKDSGRFFNHDGTILPW